MLTFGKLNFKMVRNYLRKAQHAAYGSTCIAAALEVTKDGQSGGILQ